MEWSEEEEEKKIKRCFWWNEVRIKWCSDGMKRGKKSKNIFMECGEGKKNVFDGMKWVKKSCSGGMKWGKMRMFLMDWSEEKQERMFWWDEARKSKNVFDGMKWGRKWIEIVRDCSKSY